MAEAATDTVESAPAQAALELEAPATEVVAAVETPVVETPAADTPAAEAETPKDDAPFVKAEEASLLSDEPTPAPAEEKPAEGEPLPEEVIAAEPPPQPVYDAFTLPEGFNAAAPEFQEFTKELGDFEISSKADHGQMQEFAQKMLDRHTFAVNDAIIRLQEENVRNWEKQAQDWADTFEKDPEMGGNKRDTTLRHAKSLIKTYGGTAEQQAELSAFLSSTRTGNYPGLIRLLSKAGEQLVEGRPLPATKPSQAPKSAYQKRYGAKNA